MTRTDQAIAGLPQSTAALYVLLFLGAFFTYIVLWPEAPVQEGDSSQYLEVAQDLADFRLDVLHHRTPGYPLVLALTGSSHVPTRSLFFVSLVLHLTSIWLLAAVLHSAGVGRRVLIVFCCVLLLPPYVEPAAQVMTENLTQFLLIAGLATLVLAVANQSGLRPEPRLLRYAGAPRPAPLRRGRAFRAAAMRPCNEYKILVVSRIAVQRLALPVVSGVTVGYAALTRPIYQALFLALAGCLLLFPVALRRYGLSYQSALRASAGLAAGSLLLVGGLACANHRKFDYAGLTPTLGFHLSTKTISFVERLPEEHALVREILIRVREDELTRRGGPHTGTQAIWSARPQLEAATGLSTPELSRYLLGLNMTLIRRAPIEYLQEVARSTAVYWFPAAGRLASLNRSLLRWSWATLHAAVVSAFWLQIVVLAGVTIFEASRRIAAGHAHHPYQASTMEALAYCLAGTIVFYTMLLSCAIDIGELRQRRSTDALIVFMAFLGAHVWWKAARAASTSERT